MRASGPWPIEILRPLYVDRERAVVHTSAGEDALYLADRTLWLSPEHPCVDAARRARDADPEERAPALRSLSEELADWLLAQPHLFELAAEPDDGAVGPLAAEPLLMEVAVRGLGTDDMLAQLGGASAKVITGENGPALSEVPEMDPLAAFLLSRLERPVRVADVLRQLSVERARGVSLLARLHAIGLIRPEAEKGIAPLVVEDFGAVVERLEARIARALDRDRLELSVTDHRAQAAALVADFASRNHYELLDLDPAAAEEEVQAAYERAARLIHPRHAESLGLPRGVLELLFRAATEAYVTVSDPSRRAAYDVATGIDVTARRSDEERRNAQQRFGRECYERAARAVEEERFHDAVELLREAVRLHPTVEALLLMATCLGRNPNWLRQARDVVHRARQMAPRNAGVLLTAAGLEEQLENRDEAQRLYEALLDVSPGHPEALAGLERLGVRAAGATKSGKK